jgi:hypothetical protein
MNDYLSNLSARSLGRTEDISWVSPRLPSLFESQQDLRGDSVEMSRPFVSRRPNDETPPPLSPKGNEEPTKLERSSERYIGMSISPTPGSEDISRFHRSSMEIIAAAPESSPRDHKTAGVDLAGQSLRSAIKLQTSAISSDKRPLEPHVWNQMQEEPATKDMTALTAEQTVPRPGGEGGPFLDQEKQEERPIRPPFNFRKERLVVEDTRVKERVERIFERNVSSGAEVGEHQGVMTPLMMQQSLQHPVEPILNPWKNHSHRETPAKTEQTIHVTIGRIEVRAVTPTAANRPKQKGPAPMSLDDYLRGPNGGGR